MLKQCLYKMANIIADNNIFVQLENKLKQNKFMANSISRTVLMQKNNRVILLIKFNKNLQYLEQIVLDFDCTNLQEVQFDIDVYCKQSTLDNKFYYPIQNILNQSGQTFDLSNRKKEKQFIYYFETMFDRYFQIYFKNCDNGLFV